MKFARLCDITNQGMNEGWCWGDGDFYSKTKEDTIKELRTDISKGAYFEIEILTKSDDELLELAVDKEILYWTQWEVEEEIESQGYYYTENGEEIEL